MRSSLLSTIKFVARRTVPARLRRRAWDVVVRPYVDRAALRAVVKLVRTEREKLARPVEELIEILQANGYRPAFDNIEAALGLVFRGYSCQDLIAYIYFNGKPQGFFVDIGAFDGVQISNTCVLEQVGWDGICIEPIPEVFEALQKNRACHLYNVAIAGQSRKDAKFYKVADQLGLSGLEQQMPERIQKGLRKQGLAIESLSVQTMTFDEVMKNHPAIGFIDFLSLDVEGGEMQVLETIDFERFRFGLITIENNPGTAVLRDYMAKRGYRILLDLGVDLMFVRAKD